MLRAFRVFRLFKRVPSLKKILESLANAVPGVMNAFLILFLVSAPRLCTSLQKQSSARCDAHFFKSSLLEHILVGVGLF